MERPRLRSRHCRPLRQEESEAGATPLAIPDEGASAMSGSNQVDQVETQAEASSLAAPRGLDRTELLEEHLLEAVGDTSAPVGDLDLESSADAVDGGTHLPTLGRMLDGVRE